MRRLLQVWGISAALTLLAGGEAWGQSSPPRSPVRQLPKLALAASVAESSTQKQKDVEDLLTIELGNQPFLQLVDRQTLPTVMKEHALALNNQLDAKDAVTLGKLAGADYLLYILMAKDKASVRLVETATGQVKVDAQVPLSDDLALSLAAVREKVLAAVRPESQAVHRLTVGIAALPNRSGTDRSDKLGKELEKSLRQRLSQAPWAVVLEREYPKVLLDEVDLGRAGHVNGKAVETLPPADLVISGSIDDANREYEPGKPWNVTLDLALRLRGHSGQFRQTFRSDAVETVAEKVMPAVEELRRRPADQAAVPEKELWRRQAKYLMPRRCETWGEAIVPNFFWSNDASRIETIRAWENVLVLDANDWEAMTYLGVCLIAFHRWSSSDTAVSQCVAGSQLIERALRHDPSSRVLADTFIASIGAIKQTAPARAREMAQYVVDHRQQFSSPDNYWVKSALVTPASADNGRPDAVRETWQRVVKNAEKDPDAVLLAYWEGLVRKLASDRDTSLLDPYLDSPNPVVQFAAQATLGELLCRNKKDPAGLSHFDKATGVSEAALARCHPGRSQLINRIYRLRIEACQALHRPEEAKQPALAASRRFLEKAQFDGSIAWLYHYCVTKVLQPAQDKEALAMCDAYLAAVAKEYWVGRDGWVGVAAKRQELRARLGGKPVPGLNGLRLVKGTQPELSGDMPTPTLRMAATEGKLWLVSGGYRTFGKPLVYRRAGDVVELLAGVPHGVCSLAATRDRVFFAGSTGLYEFDTEGALLKRYDRQQGAMPGDQITDVCEGGGRVYFTFQGSSQRGVAVLDPASGKISVLAPSSREAKPTSEPLGNVFRLRWDAATPSLYACCYQYWYNPFPMLTGVFRWTSSDRTWQAYRPQAGPQLFASQGGPRLVASQGDEAVVIRAAGEKTKFEFVKSGQNVSAAVPVPETMGEPGWDDRRIWAPTASGLYEIDRATGDVKWLAYQPENPFLSILKSDGRLYIATARGLYYGEVP